MNGLYFLPKEKCNTTNLAAFSLHIPPPLSLSTSIPPFNHTSHPGATRGHYSHMEHHQDMGLHTLDHSCLP
jgi:hypothetical protein